MSTYEEKKARMMAIRPPSNKGKKYNVTKRKGPKITKERFLKALLKVGPNKKKISEELDVTRWALLNIMAHPDWSDMVECYHQQLESDLDEAEATIMDMIRQRDHLPTASSAAQWLLTRKKAGQERGYSDNKTVRLEGGETPVKVQAVGQVPVDNLPLDLKLKLLEAMEAPQVTTIEAKRLPPPAPDKPKKLKLKKGKKKK